MADTQTLRVEVAQPPKREAAPRPHQPQPLTIPGKPAVISAANAATIVGTTAATVGGPVGWVVGGAVAAGGALAARHALRRRTGNSARNGASPTGEHGANGAPGRRSGNSRPGHAASKTGGSGGTSATGWRLPGAGASGRSPKGGLRGLLRRAPGTSSTGRGQGGGRKSGSGTGGTSAGIRPSSRASSSKPGGSSSVGRKLRGLLPGVGSSRGGGPTSRTGTTGGSRTGSTPASRAARAARAASRGALKGAKAASRRAGNAAKTAAKAAKNQAARARAKRQNGTSVGATKPCHTGMPRATGSTVARPGGARRATGQTPRTPPEIKPKPTNALRKEPSMASGNGAPRQGPQQGASVMWQAAKQFHDTCAGYKPKGMLEVRAEAWEMTATLTQLANGLYARAQANAKESLDPSLHSLYVKLADQVFAAASAARALGPGFDAMHQQLVNNLLKSPNPSGWDSSNNRA